MIFVKHKCLMEMRIHALERKVAELEDTVVTKEALDVRSLELTNAIAESKELLVGMIDKGRSILLEKVSSEINILRKEALDKYIASIERFFDFVKTLSLVSATASKDSKEFARELRIGQLQEKWDDEKQKKAIEIGLRLLERRRKLEEIKLTLEREERDTTDVSTQIALLDKMEVK